MTAFSKTWGVWLGAGALLAGCAANPATGGRNFTLIGGAQERALGEQTANQALEEFGLYRPGSAVTSYVQELCRETWAVTETADQTISCLFLDSEQFNAWATPGYINVYRGLLPYIQSEAQLVSVIGHEAGHVTARHVGQRVTAGMLGSLLATAVGVYVGSQVEDAGAANLAYGLAGAGVGAGLASYSRAQEYQADELGQRYMARLGYDPRESVNMIQTLLAVENYGEALSAAFNDGSAPAGGLLSGLYASHPPSPERLAAAGESAGGFPDGSVRLPSGVTPATPVTDPQGRARFHQMIDGLTYGPGAESGVATADRLYWPEARFAWQLPTGFVFRYIGHDDKEKLTLWEAAHPSSGVQARFFELGYKPGQNIANILEKLVELRSPLQRLTMTSNAEAYTAEARAPGTGGSRKVARVVAVPRAEAEKLVVAIYLFRDEAQRTREQDTLVQAAQKSRVYSAAMADQIAPLRLDSFQATSADTVARRAAALPQGALQEAHFRALNGLQPADELRAGVWYKTLVNPNR